MSAGPADDGAVARLVRQLARGIGEARGAPGSLPHILGDMPSSSRLTDSSDAATALPHRPSPRAYQLLGVAATALAVGIAEFFAWLTGRLGSPLTAVGGVVVDSVPAPVKDTVIAVFGTGDKIFLFAAMAVGLVALGLLVGAAERGRRRTGIAILAALGLVGLVAVMTRAGADVINAVPVIVGTGTGLAFLSYAGRRAAAPEADDPLDRRRFLQLSAGALTLGVVAGAVGRWASSAARKVPDMRAALRIPAPISRETIPAGTQATVAGTEAWLTPAEDFYRIDTALSVPHIDVSQWRLRIHGMVDQEIELTFDDLVGRPLHERAVTLACVSNQVGGDLVGNAVWTGVPLRELLAEAGVSPDADMVLSTSEDGFTAGTPLSALTDDKRTAMLAVTMNGEPLPFEHGYPVRMVVSGLYGYVSATKWLVDLEVTRFDQAEGYWTPRGWSAEGPIKMSSRIDVPRENASVDPDTTLAGSAWAQNTGITAVQVRLDDGEWRDATLAAVPSEDTWRQWSVRVTDLPAGSHTAEVRAVDADGQVQTSERARPDPNGSSGWHERVFTVRS